MTRPDLIAEIRRLRAAWRDSDNAYRHEQGHDTDYTAAALHAAANKRYRDRQRSLNKENT